MSDREGINRKQATPTQKFSQLVWEEVNDITIILLLLVVVLLFGFGIYEEGVPNGCYDGAIVLIAIFILVLFASIRKYWQQRRAQQKLEKTQFTQGRIQEVHVIREGEAKHIHESELIPGDVVLLKSEMMRKTISDPNTRSKLETHLDKLNLCVYYTRFVISIVLILVLFFRYTAGNMDGENGYGLDSMGEPTPTSAYANFFKKVIKESKHVTRALTKLLSVSLVGVTEGVPFVVSLAIFYRSHITLSGKTTEQDSQVVVKMASVTRILTDTFDDLTEDETEVTKELVKAFRECNIKTVSVSSKKVLVLKDIPLVCEVTSVGDSESLVMITGEVFRKFTEEERLEIVDTIRVMGEALPHDKLLLVETLRKKGEVLAFLGQKTESNSLEAIESCDLIIWDGSFCDLTSIVNSGKRFYEDIQSFLQLVLITTISSTLLNFSGTAVFGNAPLTAAQLVWVNLAVDFLGGFALLAKSTRDKPESKVPISCRRSLITGNMAGNILAQVSYQVILLMMILYSVKGSGAVGSSYQEEMKAMVSNSFIICQFFNLFNAREVEKKNFFRGIYRHTTFCVSVAAYVVLLVSFVMVQDTLGSSTRLNWKQWGGCVLVGAISWPVDWLGKCISMFIKMLVKKVCDILH